MVWGCFLWRGRSELSFVENTMDSSACCAVLSTTLLPLIEGNHTSGAIFQQDNAACHHSAYTSEWFMDMDVAVMGWPARKPDLNPIENVCADCAESQQQRAAF